RVRFRASRAVRSGNAGHIEVEPAGVRAAVVGTGAIPNLVGRRRVELDVVFQLRGVFATARGADHRGAARGSTARSISDPQTIQVTVEVLRFKYDKPILFHDLA